MLGIDTRYSLAYLFLFSFVVDSDSMVLVVSSDADPAVFDGECEIFFDRGSEADAFQTVTKKLILTSQDGEAVYEILFDLTRIPYSSGPQPPHMTIDSNHPFVPQHSLVTLPSTTTSTNPLVTENGSSSSSTSSNAAEDAQPSSSPDTLAPPLTAVAVAATTIAAMPRPRQRVASPQPPLDARSWDFVSNHDTDSIIQELFASTSSTSSSTTRTPINNQSFGDTTFHNQVTICIDGAQTFRCLFDVCGVARACVRAMRSFQAIGFSCV